MLIGIDGNEANEVRVDIGAPAGVNVYALELVKAIWRLQDDQKSGFHRHRVAVYLKNPPSPLLPKETSVFKYIVIPGRPLWVFTRLMPHLMSAKKRPDVFLSPSHYTPLVTSMPLVCSIMDLGYLASSGHLKKKDYWQLKYWTASSLTASKAILAISESTKKDVVRRYPFTKGKVFVTHLGYDVERFSKSTKANERVRIERLRKQFAIGSDYILYLGVLKPSKNIVGLIRAWGRIVNEFPKTTLVIAGKKGWAFQEIFETVKNLKLLKSIVFTDYIKEEDKPALFAGAKLFVLPSFWEGFGLDVLNSLAVGTPAVLSKFGSLPEVGGEAAYYFDPKDETDIAKKIKKVLTLPKSDYNKIVEKSYTQAGKFSWEKTAKETLKVLEKVVD